jgi:hypothetical protein
MLESGVSFSPDQEDRMRIRIRRCTPLLLAAGVAAAVVTAPMASADGADSVIDELQAKGYTVQVNWPNGFDTEPLAVCTVTNVDNPNSTPQPPSKTTIYVDVTCPNHNED